MASFLRDTEKLNEILEHPAANVLYQALAKSDGTDAVIAALSLLNKTHAIPVITRQSKSEKSSLTYRTLGNELFMEREYLEALQHYNMAIGSAPKNSDSMVSAYFNRSALLQKVKAYNAALKDIETCLSMNCPQHIIPKLIARKAECEQYASEEYLRKNALERNVDKHFFDCAVERHPEIPSVSNLVKVVTANRSRKIVAGKEIPSGTVIGVETAFASTLNSNNTFNSCHYCHKLEYNLIPCDECCETFFCSTTCQQLCNAEYHNIECKIMQVIQEVATDESFRIAMKAALKIKTKTGTWKEFVTATSNETMDPTINELYSSDNVKSMLNFESEQHFVHGARFNNSLAVATLLHYLKMIPGFFPTNSPSQKHAVRSFGRVLINMLPLNAKFVLIQNAALVYPKLDVTYEPDANPGLFSFTSKLTHSCEPNLLAVGLLNKVALIATKTISKGTELTVSHVGHWFELNYAGLRAARLLLTMPQCQCRVCIEDWNIFSVVDASDQMTQEQKEYFVKWYILHVGANPKPETMKKTYEVCCEGLDLFKNLPNSKQFLAIYEKLRMILSKWQYVCTNNNTIIV